MDMTLKLVIQWDGKISQNKEQQKMRRKKLWTSSYQNLKDAFDYIQRIKEINGDQIQVEMSEIMFGNWLVEVWQVR